MSSSSRPLALLVAVGVAIVACFGTGKRQKDQPQPDPCILDDSPNWNVYWPELAYDADLSRHCPYVVASSGDPMPFEVDFTVSPTSQPKAWYYTVHEVRNNQGTLKTLAKSHANQRDYFYSDHLYVRAKISRTYAAGTGSVPLRDSAHVEVFSGGPPTTEFPWLYVLLPGKLEAPSAAPTLTGSPFVVSGYPQAWSVEADPGLAYSYGYRWMIDGMVVSGATGPTLQATLDPGSHAISVTVTRSDMSKLNLSLNVTAVDCGGPDIC